jgi:hypothetical protein
MIAEEGSTTAVCCSPAAALPVLILAASVSFRGTADRSSGYSLSAAVQPDALAELFWLRRKAVRDSFVLLPRPMPGHVHSLVFSTMEFHPAPFCFAAQVQCRGPVPLPAFGELMQQQGLVLSVIE